MKLFVPHKIVLENGIKLAHRIYNDGFVPDVIYTSLRGGAYLGNVISEYFKLISTEHKLKPVLYAAVVARSYSDDLADNSPPAKISVDGWTYDPEYLRNGDRVLLVDDVYDTGHTINYLADVIMKNGINPTHLKIAVHDYKERVGTPPTGAASIHPDYYCRKIALCKDGPPHWVHYLSHELVGLTAEEIKEHYSPEVQAILTGLRPTSPHH